MTAPPRALIDDLLELARIPAPTFDEGERADWIEQRLAHAPGTCARDATGNVIWSWGQGRPELLVCAHLDTVFDRATPHTIRERGDVIEGPGCGDNAAAVAVAISAVEELLGAPDELKPGAVAFTVGEEGLGNLVGAYAACRALEPRRVLALEGHGVHRMAIDCVGSLRARVRVTGPGGHSWAHRTRPSAIDALLGLAQTLKAVEPAGAADSSVNLGTIAGGRSVNAIADSAELVIERRALDEAPLDAFAALLEGLRVEPPLGLELELLGRRPAGRGDRSDRLAVVAREVRASMGLSCEDVAGSTDANAAMALGIPAICLGCADGADMHTTREQIGIASLALGREQVLRVIRALLLGVIPSGGIEPPSLGL